MAGLCSGSWLGRGFFTTGSRAFAGPGHKTDRQVLSDYRQPWEAGGAGTGCSGLAAWWVLQMSLDPFRSLHVG